MLAPSGKCRARSTMRKTRISKVLRSAFGPPPPIYILHFSHHLHPFFHFHSSFSHHPVQGAGSDFSCLLPSSSSFVCRPFHVAFLANVAIFCSSSSSSGSSSSLAPVPPLFVLLQPSYRENFKFSHSQFAVTNANDAAPTNLHHEKCGYI